MDSMSHETLVAPPATNGNKKEMEQHRNKAREALIETEYRARTLEVRLEQIKNEIDELQGFSAASLIFGLLGKKAAMIEQKNGECQAFEQQYEKCHDDYARLQSEVQSLTDELSRAFGMEPEPVLPTEPEPGQNCAATNQPQCNDNPETAPLRQIGQAIQTAIKACDESIRALHDEMGTVASLGKCTVVNVRGILGGIMSGSRNRTANGCAERVQQTVARFLQKCDALISMPGFTASPELCSIRPTIEQMASELRGDGLAYRQNDQSQGDLLEQQLITANMLLEKHQLENQCRRIAGNDTHQPQEDNPAESEP